MAIIGLNFDGCHWSVSEAGEVDSEAREVDMELLVRLALLPFKMIAALFMVGLSILLAFPVLLIAAMLGFSLFILILAVLM